MRRYHGGMSIPQETIDTVWNRALDFDSAEEAPAAGDRALHIVHVFHGAAMNGGLYHAAELHREDENYPIDEVIEAYRFFDLEIAADAIEHAVTEQEELEADEDEDVDDDTIDEAEERINEMYTLEDADVEAALMRMLQSDPESFAPAG